MQNCSIVGPIETCFLREMTLIHVTNGGRILSHMINLFKLVLLFALFQLKVFTDLM